jgi:hypothetical protein
MSNRQPTLIAYSVKDRGEGQKAIWTRIGAAFPHDNGTGLNVVLDALPIGSRIVLTEPKAVIRRANFERRLTTPDQAYFPPLPLRLAA